MLEQRGGEHQRPEDTADFSFDATATHLGIPKENWVNPSVREFVGLYNRVQQLQLDLDQASITHLRRSRVGSLFSTPTEELEQERQEVRGMNPSMPDRYRRAELMMRATLELLSDNFNGNPAEPNYIKSKLNGAINGIGLEVTHAPQPDTSQY
jgi:hypothetical protein